jgi:hypothetical protein
MSKPLRTFRLVLALASAILVAGCVMSVDDDPGSAGGTRIRMSSGPDDTEVGAAISPSEAQPLCIDITDETQCLARANCTAVYSGTEFDRCIARTAQSRGTCPVGEDPNAGVCN